MNLENCELRSYLPEYSLPIFTHILKMCLGYALTVAYSPNFSLQIPLPHVRFAKTFPLLKYKWYSYIIYYLFAIGSYIVYIKLARWHSKGDGYILNIFWQVTQLLQLISDKRTCWRSSTKLSPYIMMLINTHYFLFVTVTFGEALVL